MPIKEIRRTSHTTYDCKYHIVWITKCRKKVMVGAVAVRVRELIRGICRAHDVEILKGHVSKDHVHLFVFRSGKGGVWIFFDQPWVRICRFWRS